MNAATHERLARLLVGAAAAITIALLVTVVMGVAAPGAAHITPSFLFTSPRSMGREGGIAAPLAATVLLLGVALAVAAPVGIGTAIWLTEYLRQRWLVAFITFATESLAGVPSIVFGLFGFAVFVLRFRMGWSVWSGGLTLALMILPTIVRTAQEALRAVPPGYREGALALGATRWQALTRMLLPAAWPGIATGMILSVGRAVGETAAVLLTAGSALGMPRHLGDPARSLAVHLYILAAEGISLEKAYATGTVLIILIVLVNALANRLARPPRAGKERWPWSRRPSSNSKKSKSVTMTCRPSPASRSAFRARR
ncbi:MAG: phosphate ABC transporter permease PstA [bacterium]|nr:phosphate ABC transporter permease PstA [bacterium]